MSRRTHNPKLKSLLILTAIILGGVLTIWAVIRYVGWVSPSEVLTGETGNLNTQRNAQREANANSILGISNQRQASPEVSPVAEKINVDISGTVKTEDGAPVGDALIAVYKGTQHGATPLFSNDKGEFKFSSLPLKPGNTYSLLAKVPGSGGEVTFTTQNIDQRKQVISLDVVLKPISATLSPKTSPSETPVNRDISEKLDAIDTEMGNIGSSFRTAVLLGATLLGICLLASAAIIWKTRDRTTLHEVSVNLANSTREQANIAQELQNLGKIDDVNQNLRKVVSGVHDVNQSVVRSEKKLTSILEKLRTQRKTPNEPTKTGEQLFTPPNATGSQDTLPIESYESTGIRPELPDFRETAIDSYRLYASNQQPNISPIHLDIDTGRSRGSSLEEKKKLAFRELAGQGSFIVFSRGGHAKGWLFPNPRTNYIEDLSQVFKDLTRENFQSKKSNIQPEQVERTDDYWSLLI